MVYQPSRGEKIFERPKRRWKDIIITDGDYTTVLIILKLTAVRTLETSGSGAKTKNACFLNNHTVKVKVKESRNRPGMAQRVPAGLGSQIS
jgi:hypothetical protein